MFSFVVTEDSGARLVGAMTKFGFWGPTHHGLIVGQNVFDGRKYVAESIQSGYQYVAIDEFIGRYKLNGDIILSKQPNGHEIARRAVAEIDKGQTKYHLLVNNCETFVNKMTDGTSVSWQSLTVVVCVTGILAAIYSRLKAA